VSLLLVTIPLTLATFPLLGTAPEPDDHADGGSEVNIHAGLLPPPGRGLIDLQQDDRAEHHLPPLNRERTKKETWLADKAARLDVHVSDRDLTRTNGERTLAERRQTGKARGRQTAEQTGEAPLPPVACRIEPLTTLYNLRTREALAILPGLGTEERFHGFLRDHYTNQATHMDTRLVSVLARVARKFSADRIDVVSGFRSPKYNLMLRKKGREVARQSQHTEGNAVDFRIRGVPTRRLLMFVRSLRMGGVGYYPNSQFVHSDTGRIRYWRGS
jgi:hypothetical protein